MNQTPASFRLGEIVALARARGASDIHVASGSVPAARVNGAIERLPTALLDPADVDALVVDLFSDDERHALASRGDVSTGVARPRLGRMRAHAFRSDGDACLALRLLPDAIPPIESLGLPQAVSELTGARHGLILFAGPTGSGKSTTLAAFVDRINERAARTVITIEDPIEYRLHPKRSLVRQRQVGFDVADYEEAVRGALRSDPDVIVIGEMRDAATMRVALAAAETGHLVASSVHTSGAVQTVSRIVDAFPPEHQAAVRTQLSQTLVAIVSQRLVPKVGGGRRCAAEVLIADDATRAIVRDGKLHQLRNVIATSRADGMMTFEDHLASLVGSGEVALSDALRFADHPREIERRAPIA
ncbi:MAG TPA: PilT/PilU family type 4a pilus ATPase [Candidatus Baltobacteraceae bacterium]